MLSAVVGAVHAYAYKGLCVTASGKRCLQLNRNLGRTRAGVCAACCDVTV